MNGQLFHIWACGLLVVLSLTRGGWADKGRDCEAHLDAILESIDQGDLFTVHSVYERVPADCKGDVDDALARRLHKGNERYWLIVGQGLALASTAKTIEAITDGQVESISGALRTCRFDARDWEVALRAVAERRQAGTWDVEMDRALYAALGAYSNFSEASRAGLMQSIVWTLARADPITDMMATWVLYTRISQMKLYT
jgi:hypothetical protein